MAFKTRTERRESKQSREPEELEELMYTIGEEIEREIRNPLENKERIKKLVIEAERAHYWERHHKIPTNDELENEMSENEWLLLHLGRESARI